MARARITQNGPLRMAAFSPASELGGAERSLVALASAAVRHGVQTTVLLPRPGPLAEALSQASVPLSVVRQPEALLCQSRHRLSPGGLLALLWRTPGYLRQLRQAVQSTGADILYANGLKAQLLARAVGAALGRPVVWHLREVLTGWPARLAGRVGADVVIANSHATARAIAPRLARPNAVRVVHNAVDTAEFSPGGRVRDCRSFGEFTVRVALVGALSRIKGHELLLRAARRVIECVPGAGFFFIGGAIYDTLTDQGYAATLRHAARARGLEGRVAFTGFQRQMAPWYRAMDVVVNASVQPEGFGRTLLEAMSCGRAVLGPNAGGVPEFVSHGRNGLLYEMGNAEALCEALVRLLRDPALRRRLGQAGRATAVQHFTADAHAAAMAVLLRQAARDRTCSPRPEEAADAGPMRSAGPGAIGADKMALVGSKQ